MGIIILFLIFLIFRVMQFSPFKESGFSLKRGSKDKIAVIEVEGPIFESGAVLERIRLLDDVEEDVLGVILRINSPGGAVGPSQEIYEALDMVRETYEWKIYASMEGVAASGGYWVSLVADKIYANAGTLTGSIGVIIELVNLQKLFEWLKIDRHTLKAGKFKDIGNSNRPMTLEEKALMQGVLDDIHSQFREKVSERRGIEDSETLTKITEGQIFTGRQAYELGLVDELGGFHRTYQDMVDDLQLEEKPELYYPEPPATWSDVFERFGGISLRSLLIKFLQESQVVR